MGSMQMSEATHSDDTSDDELKHTAERDDREASPAVTPPHVTFNVDPQVCLAEAEAEKEQKNESLGEIQVAECDDDTGDSSDSSQDEPPPRKLSSQMKAGLASGPDRDEDVDFLEVIDECAAEQLLSLDLFEVCAAWGSVWFVVVVLHLPLRSSASLRSPRLSLRTAATSRVWT